MLIWAEMVSPHMKVLRMVRQNFPYCSNNRRGVVRAEVRFRIPIKGGHGRPGSARGVRGVVHRGPVYTCRMPGGITALPQMNPYSIQ